MKTVGADAHIGPFPASIGRADAHIGPFPASIGRADVGIGPYEKTRQLPIYGSVTTAGTVSSWKVMRIFWPLDSADALCTSLPLSSETIV